MSGIGSRQSVLRPRDGDRQHRRAVETLNESVAFWVPPRPNPTRLG
jgi:hypothetical protein